MDPIDLMLQSQIDQQNGRPDIFSLLQGGPPQLPPTPQPKSGDMDMLPVSALLHFAASVTQPRAYGESSFGKILGSAAGGLDFYQAQKAALEDRARQQAEDQRKAALQTQQLEQSRVATVASKQDILDKAERQPLELDALRNRIQASQSEQELNQLKIRVARIDEKYAEDFKKAALAEKESKTDQDKADATLKRAQAEHQLQLARDAKVMLEAKMAAIKKPNLQAVGEALPGQRQAYRDPNTSQVYYAPMDSTSALALAKREVAAQAEITGEKLDDKETARRVRSLAQEYVRGTMDKAQGTSSAPTQGQSAPKPGELTSAQKEAIDLSNKGQVAGGKGADGTMHYYIGGKEVPEAEARARAKSAQAPGTPPTSAPAKATAANYRASTPATADQVAAARVRMAQEAQQRIALNATAAKQLAGLAVSTRSPQKAIEAMNHPGYGAVDPATQAQLFKIANGQI